MTQGAARTVPVALGDRSYDIEIAPDAIERLGPKLADLFAGARFGIVTDANVARAQLPRLEKSLSDAGLDYGVHTVSAGEASKSWPVLEQVVENLIDKRLERNDVCIACGGGVVGDLTGFAAAVTRRGMPFVQVPTSLLAQVDSSVGGKTGINSARGKNLVGAFHQPAFVAADLTALETLPKRQFAAGYAELVKHAMICDAELFDWLDAHLDEIFARGPALGEAIARSVAIKAAVVAEDEREAGRRALLNLGHTFGHALEAGCGYSDRLFHGEAVALGCVLAFGFSRELGLSDSNDLARVSTHLGRAGLPVKVSAIAGGTLDIATLMALIAQDKKVRRGALTFILTKGIGRAFIENKVDPAHVERFLKGQLS